MAYRVTRSRHSCLMLSSVKRSMLLSAFDNREPDVWIDALDRLFEEASQVLVGHGAGFAVGDRGLHHHLLGGRIGGLDPEPATVGHQRPEHLPDDRLHLCLPRAVLHWKPPSPHVESR